MCLFLSLEGEHNREHGAKMALKLYPSSCAERGWV